MAIRPVDMQIQMPRVVEASKTATAENAKPQADQTQFSQQMQKSVQAERETVVQSNRPEDSAINRDGKGNSGGYAGNKRRGRGNPGQGEKRQSDQGPDAEKRTLLDISL